VIVQPSHQTGIRGSITPISQHRDSEKCKRRMFKASKLDSKNRNGEMKQYKLCYSPALIVDIRLVRDHQMT